MKKTTRFAKVLFLSLALGILMQSCASQNQKYGCPERIQLPAFLTLFLQH